MQSLTKSKARKFHIHLLVFVHPNACVLVFPGYQIKGSIEQSNRASNGQRDQIT